MWIYELSSRHILKVNKAAINHYGYSEQEFLTMTIQTFARFDLDMFDAYVNKEIFSGHHQKALYTPAYGNT